MWRYNKLTEKALEAVQKAQALPQQNGQQHIHPMHGLTALALQRDGVLPPLLGGLSIRSEDLRKEIEAETRQTSQGQRRHSSIREQ